MNVGNKETSMPSRDALRDSAHAAARSGQERIGVLLVNSGTPDSTSTADVRRFLGNLLGDPRVVELPRALWLPILHGIILRTRPFRSARKYRKIWTERGSPLLMHSSDLRERVQHELGQRILAPIAVETGMLYANPSVETAMERLRKAGVRRLLVVPMFPQYSAVTAGAVFDQVAKVLAGWRWIPETRFVNEYHDHPAYVRAIAASVADHFARHGRPQHLVLSFHGIPEKYFEQGDPYYCKCQKSARLVAEELGLGQGDWSVTVQSRYGPGKWLKPYTDETLADLPKRGVRDVAVVCPGFAVDCLETLEEIGMEANDTFIGAGGTRFAYIPALNADPKHAHLFTEVVAQHLSGWVTTDFAQLRQGANTLSAGATSTGTASE